MRVRATVSAREGVRVRPRASVGARVRVKVRVKVRVRVSLLVNMCQGRGRVSRGRESVKGEGEESDDS